MVNKELLQRVIDTIEDNLDRWDQSLFVQGDPSSECGTTFCLAGWACALTYGEDFTQWKHSAENEGAELLGLTWSQKERLFFAFRAEDDLTLTYSGDWHRGKEAWLSFRDLVREVTGV